MEERHRMLRLATEWLDEGVAEGEVEAGLRAEGAGDEAAAISAEAREKVEQRIIRSATLPETARAMVNYYFALGVTPDATTERIRAAYRTKARVVHPDVHNLDLNPDGWVELMRVVADAETVLTDPGQRRAYDVLWARRARRGADRPGADEDGRGDFASNFLWQMAELAEHEEDLAQQVDRIASAEGDEVRREARLATLQVAGDAYEGDILDLRTQTYMAPREFEAIAGDVRRELQRKERLVLRIKDAIAVLGNPRFSARERGRVLDEVAELQEEVRLAHHRFDIQQTRRALHRSLVAA